ncbi:MAG: hypothetical protein HY659_00020 [Rhizobiales bacterium]|nr:hypothetical protein [Hyphomicrobiales bacterium]
MRLERLKLVGIAIAAGWIAGAILYLQHADIRAAKFLRNSSFEICDYVNYHLALYSGCWHDLMKIAASLDNAFANLAILSLAPVLLLWLAATIAQKLWRLMRASRP